MTSEGYNSVFRRLSVKGTFTKEQMGIANYRALTCSSSGAIHTVYLQGSAVAMAVETALTEN